MKFYLKQLLYFINFLNINVRREKDKNLTTKRHSQQFEAMLSVNMCNTLLAMILLQIKFHQKVKWIVGLENI